MCRMIDYGCRNQTTRDRLLKIGIISGTRRNAIGAAQSKRLFLRMYLSVLYRWAIDAVRRLRIANFCGARTSGNLGGT